MRLQIDCYSKEKFAIQIDYSGRYPIEKSPKGDLFLFVCYVLRQLYNLGDHMVADALAGLLIENPVEIINGAKEIPSGADILIIKHVNLLQAQGMDELQATFQAMKMKNQLGPNGLVKVLENDFLSNIPNLQLIKYKGDTKKQFILSLPPLNLDMKGFGFLFGDVRYYSLASTLIFYKFLMIKYKGDSEFGMRLQAASTICAKFHFFKKIPVDIPALASETISKAYNK